MIDQPRPSGLDQQGRYPTRNDSVLDRPPGIVDDFEIDELPSPWSWLDLTVVVLIVGLAAVEFIGWYGEEVLEAVILGAFAAVALVIFFFVFAWLWRAGQALFDLFDWEL